MTKQIIIKLNEKRFKPVFDKLLEAGHGVSKSYSEIAGKTIFYCYLAKYEKLPELGNKTKMEFLLEHMGISSDEDFLNFLQEYVKFTKNGKLPNRR